MTITKFEEEMAEAFLNGEDIELTEQETEEDIKAKNMTRAKRRKSSIMKTRRKKAIYANMSDAKQQTASLDFWDEDGKSHGRGSGRKRKAYLKKAAARSARRSSVGSGKGGYKKSFDLDWELS